MSNKYIDVIDMLCPDILIMCENQEDYDETVAAFIKNYKSLLTSRVMCTDVQVGYNAMMIDGFVNHEIDKSRIKFLMQNARITFAVQLESIGFYTQVIFTDKCNSETINLARKHYRNITSYHRLVRELDDSRFRIRPLYDFELDPANDNILFIETANKKLVKIIFEGQE